MKNFRAGFLAALALIAGAATTRAFAQSAAPGSDNAGFKAATLSSMEVMGKRAVAMANGIPAENFTWTPGNGGRTVANLFLHLAFSLWTRPAAFGAAAPAGFDVKQKANDYENSTTDKAKVVEQLTQAFAYAENSLRSLPDADLGKHVKSGGGAGGGDNTILTIISGWEADNSEHIGQLMVYSRVHGFSPPTPGDVAKQAAGQ